MKGVIISTEQKNLLAAINAQTLFQKRAGNLQILREISWDQKCWVQAVSEFCVAGLLGVCTFQGALRAVAPRAKGRGRPSLLAPGQSPSAREEPQHAGLERARCSRGSSEALSCRRVALAVITLLLLFWFLWIWRAIATRIWQTWKTLE